ncbi:MAG: tetratricopeptide repeat protein [Salinivirgaceae bacterium]|jgi:tetratricopeptide (TPR) repeat protein|nr:tetratricopeptide repeat protein [Salinivirgaceae bacterium]
MKIYLTLFCLLSLLLSTNAQNSDSLLKVGMELIREHQFEKAIPVLEKAKSLDAEKINIRLQLAFCFTQTEQLDESIKLYQQIIDERPDFVEGYYMLANAFLLKEDYKNALIMSDISIEAGGDNPDHYLIKAQVLRHMGNLKDACKYYKKAKRRGSHEAEKSMEKYCK